MAELGNLSEEVNGIILPHHVVRELQSLANSLVPSFYTAHQLQSMVLNSQFDRKVVDDHKGKDIYDQMDLTKDEISFREKIEREREEGAAVGVSPLSEQN